MGELGDANRWKGSGDAAICSVFGHCGEDLDFIFWGLFPRAKWRPPLSDLQVFES
jgi:hypothetical protein